MAADALAETILNSHGGGGNWKTAFALAGGTLDALEAAEDRHCLPIILQFFWNWLDILGLRPESLPPLNPGARRWLAVVEELEPGQVCRYSLDTASLAQTRTALTAILAEALGRRLATWDW
jgi:hypothetical protein